MLRDTRERLAREASVPSYVVASNRTLDEMASKRPTTRTAMLALHGMGPKRYQRYGSAFIDVLRDWASP